MPQSTSIFDLTYEKARFSSAPKFSFSVRLIIFLESVLCPLIIVGIPSVFPLHDYSQRLYYQICSLSGCSLSIKLNRIRILLF
ncbi:hypothetical protein M501DRAFT_534709 [Patellaria atrata CBS 101060]|uniref:Uncharacterized protein n=1 Tax=Patellaria atrata CBS 101060 TaxID=1346257 RepID=A0A9P4SEW3_9PEZI|nr:hypothetical protein M501DRAFT_534709 [Patellaria atrata CBS 101060]